ncbi:LutB/LldF family L-lactate oxidation iron-sulfur protein [Saccharothrix syringae]|uniref:Iron-sulfur cluster-binding protein n=1 Tax=Saccharothrix syringae TaxID=103733 RepID=A0A5Q0GXV0_SACSY|nr:LutB/LldF family L-lactate oxidation iron-sulfur protein [Saccharothrix syringae]QFZ18192.1 iron-sulfur cluster-binding protein [Saccharothrix syringae]
MSTFLGMPAGRGNLTGAPFPEAAREALGDAQLRRNLAKATTTIRAKRATVVGELPDWAALRAAGAAIKDDVLANLDEYLVRFEEALTARGTHVHWARDADEANRIVTDLVTATGTREVIKVKSMATAEIGLNEALARAGVHAVETDLAELIVQLGHDRPSHILVPAIHRGRAEIREIFRREMPDVDPDLTADPRALAEAAREHLRRKFLTADVAISGANFGIAETGSLVVVESEGNGRMCLTLPRTLISVVGIEKMLPTWRDLEVFLQLLPRSSTGERMNPYTSVWTGPTEGQTSHVVLVDNGRTAVLADPDGRAALRCIRCSACLNSCPVYERTGGHAYGSTYPGPIGAVLSPQLTGVARNPTLPFASSLCGVCYDVCPVAIDIPSMLVHLRGKVVEAGRTTPESTAMRALAWVMSDARRWRRFARLGKFGRTASRHVPLPGWSTARDVPQPPRQTFRDWWEAR